MANTSNKKPLSLGLTTIVGGLVTLIFLGFAASQLLSGGRLLGVLGYLLMALLAMPYLWEYIRDSYKLNVSLALRIVLIVVILIIVPFL